MTEKDQKQSAHLAPQINPYGRVDEEASSVVSKELRRQKRMKCFLYVIGFAVFQIGIITLFSLTIMKFRTPKFRVRSATFDPIFISSSDNSFNTTMNAQFGIKNTNFGQFKYSNTTIDFYYRNTKVGEAIVPWGKAKFRSTKKFNVTANLSFTNVLQSDINNGALPLRSESRVRGKVTIMFIMKKNRATNMNCTMDMITATRELQNVMCN